MQLLYYIALFIIFGIHHMQDHVMVLKKVTLLKSCTKQVKAPVLIGVLCYGPHLPASTVAICDWI